MKDIIPAVDRALLKQELNENVFVRTTRKGGNEIYIVDYHNSPNVIREIGRLREVSFRNSGGGTGKDIDLDDYDTSDTCYEQLIVWSPEDEEIIGGYRFIECEKAITENEIHLSTAHYFKFGDKFIKEFLPKTIELGRSWVQPAFQPAVNPKKGLFALDNIWDGLGAIIRVRPHIEFFFGKVTMYPNYNREGRNALLNFMNIYFPDQEELISAYHPLDCDLNNPVYKEMFASADFKEDFKKLNGYVRERGEFIPPLINIYMNLSPTMKTFGTAVNQEFGSVEETAILVRIADIYEEKKARHVNY